MTRSIAYKIAQDYPDIDYPNEYILEWTYIDLHAPGSLQKRDGWRFTDNEDAFIKRYNANDLLLKGLT